MTRTVAPPALSSASQALFVVFLWSTSWVLIKYGLAEIPPLTFAGLRYALASACLLPLAWHRLQRAPAGAVSKRSLIRLAILGLLLYAVTQGALFVALAELPAVTVNLLWSFSTVVVALLGLIALAESPTGFQWGGVLLAMAGAAVYFTPAAWPAGRSLGLAAAAIGVLANAGAAVLGRDVNRAGALHPIVVTAISMGAGSLSLLAAGLATQGLPPISAASWAIIAWLAVVNTAFAFTVWNHTLRTLSAAQSSILNGTMLIWIPILAVLFLGETITLRQALGLLAAAAGTLMVQLRSPTLLRRILPRPGRD